MEHDGESSLIADERQLRTANWALRLAGLLLFAGFGATWAFGLVWLFSVQAGWAGFWFGALGFAPFGCVVLWQAVKRVVTYIRFGQGSGQIAPGDLSEGTSFLFTYKKPVHVPTTVDLTTSLVLRERVLSKGGQENVPPCRDHLVRSCRESRVRCAGRSILGTQCRFEIPAGGTAEFVTAGGLLTWVVKVHIELRRGMDVWDCFELPAPAGRQFPVAPKQAASESDYQVIVNVPVYGENYLKAMLAIRGFLPHLDDEQAGEFLKYSPVTLLANVTRDEAETARGTLHAAGARVLVSRGGQLVKGRKLPDLPLPHAGPGEMDRALPVPSSETDGSN